MRPRKKLLAIAAATVLLGTLAATAAAGRISTSELRLTATFATAEFAGPFGTTRCPVTVEGSFHERTTDKTAARLVGYITSDRLGACTAGSATVLTETLPWHITYSSFSGTLPNITAFNANIIGMSFIIREGASNCLARSTTTEPGRIALNRESGGVLSSATMSGELRAGLECLGVKGTLRGTSNSLTAARITLI